MGEVYEATDVILARKVALKVLPDRLANNEISVKRFLLEARAAARLNHSNAVAIYDVARSGDFTYITMEMVAGSTAQEHLEKYGPLSPEKATAIIAAACRGLAAAHRVGLVHRDVKPANILLSDDGSVKVSDFGLAKATDLPLDVTQENALLGTPGYMSPEQCEGRPADPRSDIYSLGCTYFALLTGKPPYQRETLLKTLNAHCQAEIPDPRQRMPGLPEACARITARALAKKPEDRYPTAEAMLADLEQAFGSGIFLGIKSSAVPGGMTGSGSTSSSGSGTGGLPSGSKSPNSSGSWTKRSSSIDTEQTMVVPAAAVQHEDEPSGRAMLFVGVATVVAAILAVLFLCVLWNGRGAPSLNLNSSANPRMVVPYNPSHSSSIPGPTRSDTVSSSELLELKEEFRLLLAANRSAGLQQDFLAMEQSIKDLEAFNHKYFQSDSPDLRQLAARALAMAEQSKRQLKPQQVLSSQGLPASTGDMPPSPDVLP